MRSRTLLLAVICLLTITSIAIADSSTAPSITSATAGSKTIAVTSPAFPGKPADKKATYALYKLDPGKLCSSSATKLGVIADSNNATDSNSTNVQLSDPLVEGQRICAIETFLKTNGTADTANTKESNVVTVGSTDANWGRVRAYFVGGILISNDSSAFSAAHQFYELNIEKTWKLPGCYLHVLKNGDDTGECAPDDASAAQETPSSSNSSTLAQGATSSTPGRSSGKKLKFSAGTLKAAQAKMVLKGTITLGSPVKISKAVLTVAAGDDAEKIEFTDKNAGPEITLQPGQSIAIDSGTLTATSIAPTSGGLELAAGDTIEIASGAITGKKARSPLNGLHSPGITSYFETRLTAIPVASNAANTTATPSTPNPTPTVVARYAEDISTSATTTATGLSSTGSFLTSQQTANVGVGVYLPILFSRWDFEGTPNALFIAPMSKIGFNTITAPTTQTVVLPGGTPGTQTFEQIYNYYGYGARVGHIGLTKTNAVAPEIYSYLDVIFGRYSNLESLVCHLPGEGGIPEPTSTSGCGIYTHEEGLNDVSRKRLYRMDLEGLLKIPKTAFYVGLNANIGQKEVQAEKLAPNFKAPDDLRFLFGTKFDIADLFTKLGVKLP